MGERSGLPACKLVADVMLSVTSWFIALHV